MVFFEKYYALDVTGKEWIEYDKDTRRNIPSLVLPG